MNKVAIIADSSCCLPKELIDEYGIIIVPLGLLFGSEMYEDGSLSGGEFYRRLAAERRIPTTTAPAPGHFLEAFRIAAQRAQAALCITLAASYSGIYSSAVNAAELAEEELPGFPIKVMDSHNLAMSYGFVVLAAARAAASGADLEGVAAAAEAVISRTHLIGVLDTLRYAAKSGRVPLVLHWAASAFQIKPIFAAEQEEVRALERVRTRSRALDRLLAHVGRRVQAGKPLHMAVMHANALETAEALAHRLRETLHPQELLVTEFTPVMGIHSGPGFVGVSFYHDDGGGT